MGDWKIQRLQVNGNGQFMPLTPDLRMKEQQSVHEVCRDAKPGVGITVAHEDLGVLAKPEFSGKGIFSIGSRRDWGTSFSLMPSNPGTKIINLTVTAKVRR